MKKLYYARSEDKTFLKPLRKSKSTCFGKDRACECLCMDRICMSMRWWSEDEDYSENEEDAIVEREIKYDARDVNKKSP